MEIKRVQVKDFLALKKADVDLSGCPVHIFLGPNDSGKSSFRDAIDFAFTGTCRKQKKKDAGRLARHGTDKLAVKLTTGAGDITRTATGCSLKEGDLESLFGPPDVIKASLSGFRFLDLSPAERRELVLMVSGSSAALPDAVRKLAKEAGLPDEDVFALGVMAQDDLDKCENLATSKRRELKRQLEEQGEAPPATITLNGKTFDLAKISAEEVKAQLATRNKERDDAMRAEGAASLLDAPDIIEKKMEELHKEIEANRVTEGSLKAAKDAAETASDKVKTAQLKVERANLVLQAARTRYHDAEALKNICPTCGQAVSKDILNKLTNDALEAGEAAAKAKQEAEASVGPTQRAYTLAAEALANEESKSRKQEELAAAYRGLAHDKKEAESFAGLKAHTAKLDKSVATGGALLEAKTKHAEYERISKNREATGAMIESWDKVAKELGKDGSIRKLASRGFDLTIVQEAANTLLGGQHVEVDEAWNIWLEGKHAELLSPSVRFRLGAAFAAAFAIAGGLKILILDEADVLDENVRRDLSAWVRSLASKIDLALIFTHKGNKPQAFPVAEGFRFWWVEAGEVAAV